jgi:glycosyltransferase involved in cell wall biosynthesis
MKTIVVLPAYNAEKTLEKTISEIPMEAVNEIILVDDASSDRTFEIAKTLRAGGLPITAKKHSRNSGYGANQKTCYRLAMDRGAEIVVMLHPDYQYDPKLIRYFVEFISKGYFDVMLGARIRSRKECLEGGMPGYKYYSNRFLSLIENIATGRNLSEWHTGMRAYKTEVLENIPFETFSDDFVFDSQVLLAIAENNFRIGDIPVPVRYFKEASSINFLRSARYGILTLWEVAKLLARRSVRRIKI